MYNCPHCHKSVKNLKKHIKRMHPDQVKEEPAPKPTASPQKLEIKIPPVKKKKEETETPEPETKGYHCVDCGHSPITKGLESCPSCGARLDWSQL